MMLTDYNVFVTPLAAIYNTKYNILHLLMCANAISYLAVFFLYSLNDTFTARIECQLLPSNETFKDVLPTTAISEYLTNHLSTVQDIVYSGILYNKYSYKP